jgi:hypothetical protein
MDHTAKSQRMAICKFPDPEIIHSNFCKVADPDDRELEPFGLSVV